MLDVCVNANSKFLKNYIVIFSVNEVGNYSIQEKKPVADKLYHAYVVLNTLHHNQESNSEL